MDLMLKYKNRIILEIGAHDHWSDIRYINDNTYGPFRSLFVAPAISPIRGQMPGYAYLEINNGVAQNPHMVSLDITASYGQSSIPSLANVPSYRLDYS
jgi:hypothetical protein